MTYANATERKAFIAGLRELADFLENNTDVPAPIDTYVFVFPPYSLDSEKRREIDIIASLINSGTQTYAPRGHYMTVRRFGPVEYRATAIPADIDEEA
jgi:hypothetical protein